MASVGHLILTHVQVLRHEPFQLPQNMIGFSTLIQGCLSYKKKKYNFYSVFPYLALTPIANEAIISSLCHIIIGFTLTKSLFLLHAP